MGSESHCFQSWGDMTYKAVMYLEISNALVDH